MNNLQMRMNIKHLRISTTILNISPWYIIIFIIGIANNLEKDNRSFQDQGLGEYEDDQPGQGDYEGDEQVEGDYEGGEHVQGSYEGDEQSQGDYEGSEHIQGDYEDNKQLQGDYESGKHYKVTMKATSSYKVIMKAMSQEKVMMGKGKAIMKTTSQGKVMAMDMTLIKSKAVMVNVMGGARMGGQCRGRGKRYVTYGGYSLELICGIHLKSGYQQ